MSYHLSSVCVSRCDVCLSYYLSIVREFHCDVHLSLWIVCVSYHLSSVYVSRYVFLPYFLLAVCKFHCGVPLFLHLWSVCVSCLLSTVRVSRCDVCQSLYLWPVYVFLCSSHNLSVVYTFCQNLFLPILSIFFSFLSFWTFSCFSSRLSRKSPFRCDVSSFCTCWILHHSPMNCPFFVSSSCVFCDHFGRPFLPVQVCPIF